VIVESDFPNSVPGIQNPQNCHPERAKGGPAASEGYETLLAEILRLAEGKGSELQII